MGNEYFSVTYISEMEYVTAFKFDIIIWFKLSRQKLGLSNESVSNDDTAKKMVD